MAVETPPPELGAPCPSFRLPAVDGKTYARDDFAAAPALCVMFICNHCPYVKAVEDRIIRLARAFEGRGVQIVAVCSNDAESYPDDAFDKLARALAREGVRLPLPARRGAGRGARLRRGLHARHLRLRPADARRLAYRGRIDDSWKDESKVTRHELAEALEALVSGRAPSAQQRPSMGCSIKWRQQEA